MADEPKTPPPSVETPAPSGVPVDGNTIADLLDGPDFGDLSGQQRAMVRRLFRAEKPTGDITKWLTEVRGTIGATGAAQSGAKGSTPAAFYGGAQPVGKSDGGAPGGVGQLALPDNITSADPRVLAAMKPEDRKKWAERVLQMGINGHPAHRRR
jgi:hypothetical protein